MLIRYRKKAKSLKFHSISSLKGLGINSLMDGLQFNTGIKGKVKEKT